MSPTPCARGCTTRGRHQPGCPCTLECGQHPDHCEGCWPRPATLGLLCNGCTSRLRNDLAEIPDLAAAAAARDDGHLNTPRKPTDVSRAGTPTPTSVSPAWDAYDEAAMLLLTWVDLLTELTGQNGPPRYTIAGVPTTLTIGVCAHWLTISLYFPAAHDPVQFYDEIHGLRRTLQWVTGTDDAVTKIRDLCPACDQRTLEREDGAASVVCRNPDCGRVWRDAEWLAHILAAQYEEAPA